MNVHIYKRLKVTWKQKLINFTVLVVSSNVSLPVLSDCVDHMISYDNVIGLVCFVATRQRSATRARLEQKLAHDLETSAWQTRSKQVDTRKLQNRAS